MAIKFEDSATIKQYLTAADSADLTFPNGDWCLAFFFSPDGERASTLGYLISNANYGGPGQLNVQRRGSGATGYQGKLGIYLESFTAASSASIVQANQHLSGWRLYVIQRSGTTCTLRSCPVLSSAPSDGSAVVAEGSAAISQALDGTGFKIGARQDLNSDRYADSSMSRVFRYDGTLSDLEVARLAYGEQITDLGYTPVWYIPLSDNEATGDTQGTISFAKIGDPATVADPAWGYSGHPVTTASGACAPLSISVPSASVGHENVAEGSFAAIWMTVPDGDAEGESDEIFGGDAVAHRIYQRTDGAANVLLSGSYSGTLPTSIEARVVAASDGSTVVQGWTALTDAEIAGGTWSGVLSIPQGGMYRVQVRSMTASSVLAEGYLGSSVFGVGDLFGCIGSSSASLWFSAGSYTPSATVRRLRSTGWSEFPGASNGAAVELANDLSIALGVPVGMLDFGVSGSTLDQWSQSDGSHFLAFASAITGAGGKLAAVLSMVGSNDAAGGSVSSKASHLAKYQSLIENVRAHTDQPNLPIFISGTQRRVSETPAAQWSWLREAEKSIADPAVSIYLGATTIDLELSGDNIHLSAAGYRNGLQRMALAMRDVLASGTYHRGPKIVAIEYSGASVTVDVEHVAGTDFTPASGITGFAVTDSVGALTITSAVRTTAMRITLSLDRDISGVATVTYQAGASPVVTGAVTDNTSLALPLEYETELVAVDAAAGTWSGVLAPLTIGAPAGGAAVLASVQASFVPVNIVSAAGDSSVAVAGAGAVSTITLVAPSGTADASTATVASGSVAPLLITSPSAVASAHARASGALPEVSLAAPSATAQGVPVTSAAAAFAPLGLSAPLGASDVLASVSGLVAGITITPPLGSASSGDAVEAVGIFAEMHLSPPQAECAVRAASSGVFRSVHISPPAAYANDGGPIPPARRGYVAGAALHRRYVA